MNVAGGCLLTGGSAPSCEGAGARRLTAAKGLATALLAAVALVAGMPAWPAGFPVFTLNSGQIPDPAPFSVSSDGLNYVAKKVTVMNDGNNNINRIRLTVSASASVAPTTPPVKDFSPCAQVPSCTSETHTATSVTYFFDVFPAHTSVDVFVSFPTPISTVSTSSPTMNVLAEVRINNTSSNSSQLLASFSPEQAKVNLGGDPANVTGYLPKNGGQVTALRTTETKGSLKTTLTFPSNSITSPVGSVTQEVDPNSCISIYRECLDSSIHLPATGTPATPAAFADILKIALELNVAALTNPASTKPTDITILYQKQDWQCAGSPTCTFQFVPIGNPLPVQPCNADGTIPEPPASGFAAGRCLLPPVDLTTGTGSKKKGVYKYLVNSRDNGNLLFR